MIFFWAKIFFLKEKPPDYINKVKFQDYFVSPPLPKYCTIVAANVFFRLKNNSFYKYNLLPLSNYYKIN